MIGVMEKVQYVHSHLRSLVSVATAGLYRWIVGRLSVPRRAGRPLLPWRRLVVIVAVLLTLVIEAVMLYWLSELVDLCIMLMEVWTELARKHLELTL